MVASSLAALVSIAHAGARKMPGQGYTAEFYDEDSYLVSRPGDDGEPVTHRVFVTAPLACDCPFFLENYPAYGAHTTCKHIVFAADRAANDEWADALEAANTPPDDAITAGDSYQVPGLYE